MNTIGRRLWMHAAGILTGMLFLGMAWNTTVFAEGVTQADMSGAGNAQTETIQTEVLLLAAQGQAETVQKMAQEQAKAAQEAAAAAALAQQKAAQEAAAAAARQAAEAAARTAMEDALLAQKGGESYIGQVAVGNVVMNRMESGKHPNTITGVVYEPGQFSPVRNGSLKRTLGSGNVNASCRQAALEAIAGAEPVGDKLFFRRVNGRSGQVIGNHVFY